MSEAFERFLQGEDRLARLLCALPAYTPSAEFDAAFARAAHAAQAARVAPGAIQSASAAAPTVSPGPLALAAARIAAAPSAFEPPASLEANFLKLAARIESAQAPRRAALLAGIGHGDSPQAMLGAAIQPATEEWLRAQALTASPTPAATPASPDRQRSFLGFRCFDLRLAAVAGILAVVGTQLALLLIDRPDAPQLAEQDSFQTALAPAEAAKRINPAGNAERSLGEAPAALKQTPAATSPERQDELRLATREAAAASVALKKSAAGAAAPHALLADAADGPRPASASPPLATVAPADRAAVAATLPAAAQLPASKTARPGIRSRDTADETPADTRAAAPDPPAAPAMSAAAEPPEKAAASAFSGALKEEAPPRARAIDDVARREAKQLQHSVRAAAALATTPGEPRQPILAAAPGAAAAPAAMPRQRTTESSLSVTLADDPARVASRLPARPAGAVWAVYSTHARRPELDRWLENLRQQIPASGRPARFEVIEDDTSTDPTHLRIVPPALPERR
ncbi:hypothetical protein [Candidatus Accumulibacter sp. ACC003]|uniref:hypothetical protein n=1 Tax=Candidatus Accumulibacter sp. ACC003 TaxID=2823334 RepID=UPI0025C4D565|nr:hypothetical protein [Candidatus Accumulibacter sp. ACC003]